MRNINLKLIMSKIPPQPSLASKGGSFNLYYLKKLKICLTSHHASKGGSFNLYQLKKLKIWLTNHHASKGGSFNLYQLKKQKIC